MKKIILLFVVLSIAHKGKQWYNKILYLALYLATKIADERRRHMQQQQQGKALSSNKPYQRILGWLDWKIILLIVVFLWALGTDPKAPVVTMTMLGGATVTLSLFAVCFVLSIPLGLVLTLMRDSKFLVLRLFTDFYVWLMRGTPLMLQLFFIYFALPKVAYVGKLFLFSSFQAACFAFVINYAAYFCEIFRGALLSVDKGQYEAAKALGLGWWDTMRCIIFPQMVRVALPAVTNESVTLVKDTALVTIVGVLEITHYAKALVNTTGGKTYPYLIAAIIYLVLNDVLMRVFQWLEKKYKY